MGQAEIVVIGLLVAVAGLSALARRRSLPYPIVLVLGGALLGFVPGLPEVRLDPEVVLVVFLPPLLYGSSSFANVNDFRGDLRWLALIPGLPLGRRLCPGAIVSPTDPPAAATIMRRLGVPRRLVSAVEARACSTTRPPWSPTGWRSSPSWPGTFSPAQAGPRFVLEAAGGVAIGLVVGWLVAKFHQRTTVAVDTLAAADSSADPGRASPAARPRRKGPEMDRATLSSCQRPALRSGDRSPRRLERSAVVAVQWHVPRESVGA